jgi:hypothetical protein
MAAGDATIQEPIPTARASADGMPLRIFICCLRKDVTRPAHSGTAAPLNQ